MTGTLFRDAELALIDHLTDAFGDLPVVGVVPNPRPAQFIRIERVGGSRETRVTESAQFVIEAWAGTDADAATLLNTARSYLFDVDSFLFGADEYAGPARLPDPDSNMARYTASFLIRVRSIQ